MARKNIYDPAKTYNLEDFIALRNTDTATYYNLSIIEKIDGVEHLYWNLVDDYLEHLPVSVVKLDDDQFLKYRYHPDLLAYDVYGSTQLDFIVLALNDMVDPKEFCRKKIYLPFSSNLKKFLDDVNSSNSILLRQNRLNNNMKIK